jgi:hypothetical protein
MKGLLALQVNSVNPKCTSQSIDCASQSDRIR